MTQTLDGDCQSLGASYIKLIADLTTNIFLFSPFKVIQLQLEQSISNISPCLVPV